MRTPAAASAVPTERLDHEQRSVGQPGASVAFHTTWGNSDSTVSRAATHRTAPAPSASGRFAVVRLVGFQPVRCCVQVSAEAASLRRRECWPGAVARDPHLATECADLLGTVPVRPRPRRPRPQGRTYRIGARGGVPVRRRRLAIRAGGRWSAGISPGTELPSAGWRSRARAAPGWILRGWRSWCVPLSEGRVPLAAPRFWHLHGTRPVPFLETGL